MTNRIIKFNYWDGEQIKKADIIHVCEVDGIITFRAWDGDLHEYFDLIEFTGLLDTNGKEIYEGDIVQYPNGYKRIVEWHEAYWQFRTIGGKEYTDIRIPGDERIFRYEIIGNLFETPDLLK